MSNKPCLKQCVYYPNTPENEPYCHLCNTNYQFKPMETLQTKSKCCNSTYKLTDDLLIKGISICDECHKICMIIEGEPKQMIIQTDWQILKSRANLQ